MLNATDTDVLVVAIATASALEGCEIWLAFGRNKHFRYIVAHMIAAEFTDDWYKGLLITHAFSQSHVFCGIGKKTVWDTWRSLPSLTTVFGCLSHTPEAISDNHMKDNKRFVVLLYSCTSQILTVNAAKKQLFNRKLENLPSSRVALYQNVKCASFQAGYIWGQALIANPSPGDWGWKKDADGRWTPLWTTLSNTSKQYRELIKCNYKKCCFWKVARPT